jgi:hypothetical protein
MREIKEYVIPIILGVVITGSGLILTKIFINW